LALIGLVIFGSLMTDMPAWGADMPALEESPPARRIELRGTLIMGVVAIGGETTGSILRVGSQKWELDLGHATERLRLAQQLDRQQVVVRGTLTQHCGVESGTRTILLVTSLRAAKPAK
jgi:hypothetical protein